MHSSSRPQLANTAYPNNQCIGGILTALSLESYQSKAVPLYLVGGLERFCQVSRHGRLRT